MDVILGISAVAVAFAGLWLILALVLAALAGAVVVAIFGSLFFLTNRLLRYWS